MRCTKRIATNYEGLALQTLCVKLPACVSHIALLRITRVSHCENSAQNVLTFPPTSLARFTKLDSPHRNTGIAQTGSRDHTDQEEDEYGRGIQTRGCLGARHRVARGGHGRLYQHVKHGKGHNRVAIRTPNHDWTPREGYARVRALLPGI